MYISKSDGGNYTPPPAGNHFAICFRFIDLGTQMVEWKGTQKTQRKVLLSWELPNELMTEGERAGQPFTIGRRYTWSMHEKANLRHDLENWRGRKFTDEDFVGPKRFNTKNLLGKACMLSVVHETREGNTYANISSVAALPKGMVSQVPAPNNPMVYFALEPDSFDASVLEAMSDKLKETITGSPEYKELIDASYRKPNGGDNGDPRDMDDEIPF